MENGYDRKTGYVFGGASSFWFLFVAIALIIWLSPLFIKQENSSIKTLLIGAAALLLGLCLRFTFYGTQVDPERGRIREYTSLLGYRTGDWEKLPDLKRLRFTSNNVSSRNTPNGISPTMRHTSTVYTIALFSYAATPDYVIKTENKKEALQDAQALAKILHLKVEDRL
ncbi:hypothetical protein DXT99_12000 [Pontibacter diazotrophicus]|uniref:PH domain-containing protein n=1 Tax=Pontibacter diazotrophicus TaxID=1400979 RepID=A0A3D8LC31_9BACT|nr:hypothetical protein [Pontibacter diazotrophicus]RDV14999.1 hypothetical protein DXT99_12000 [Pontibacter diazotrophicus]